MRLPMALKTGLEREEIWLPFSPSGLPELMIITDPPVSSLTQSMPHVHYKDYYVYSSIC